MLQMRSNIRALNRIPDHTQQYAPSGLNIIEEFAALSTKRKVMLSDSLSSENPHSSSFDNAVKLLWPQASTTDIKKLKNFLTLLNSTI